MSKWKSTLSKIGAWQQTESQENDEGRKDQGIATKVLKKWKVNSIDEGSIYAIGPQNIASKSMPVSVRPPTTQQSQLLETDLSKRLERRYINRARISSPSSRSFKKHIIQKYNAPPRDLGLGYRTPRPPNEKRDEHELAVEAIRKKPTVIKTSSMASLSRPVRCQDECQESHIYCDVLGPATCSSCIELTNKCLAEELQRRLFPDIDTSTNSLVAPRVADVLCKRDGPVYVPYMHNGQIDYASLRRKSTVTDRFRRMKIICHDLPVSTSSSTATPKRRIRHPRNKMPGIANLLKAML